jgi:hypothetical protein
MAASISIIRHDNGRYVGVVNIELEAEQRLRQFVKTIYDLITSKGVQVNLLVCGGNTGLVMAYITERIYTIAGIALPHKLALPTYRYYPGFLDDAEHLFDNSALHYHVESALVNFPKLRNVLFVDDEIGLGITALTIHKLLTDWQQAHHPRNVFNYYIVAEDQGFQLDACRTDSSIYFCPYAYEMEGWNNVIANIVPKDYSTPITQVFPEEILPFHQRMNILLDLPTKEFADGQPRFGSSLLEQAKEMVPNLRLIQQGFSRFLDEKVSSYLGEIAEPYSYWFYGKS